MKQNENEKAIEVTACDALEKAKVVISLDKVEVAEKSDAISNYFVSLDNKELNFNNLCQLQKYFERSKAAAFLMKLCRSYYNKDKFNVKEFKTFCDVFFSSIKDIDFKLKR